MIDLRPTLLCLFLCFSFCWAQPYPEKYRALEFDEACGVYIKSQKAGYTLCSRTIDLEAGTLEEITTNLFRMNVGGSLSEDHSVEKVSYSLQDGMVESFSVEERSGTSRTTMTGTREGGQIRVVQDGESRVVNQPKGNLERDLKFIAWLKAAEEGETFEDFDTHWDRDPIDVPSVYTFVGRGQKMVAGVKLKVLKVSYLSEGLALDLELDERGMPLYLRDQGGLLEMKFESREQALKLEESPVNLFAETGVRLDSKLGKDFVQHLDLVASNVGEYQFPQSSYQKASPLAGKRTRLRLVSPKKPAPEPLENRAHYTRATPTLQTAAAPVQSILSELDLRGTDREKVTILSHWVYQNLGKSYDQNASNASTVLRNGGGDCTEHALLFTTLARGAGIPTREVSGLVYGGDDIGRFVHHAWAESYVDGGWLAVDPTFDQFPADATHILLGRENDLSGLIHTSRLGLQIYRSKRTGDRFLLVLFFLLGVLVLGTVVYGVRLQQREL